MTGTGTSTGLLAYAGWITSIILGVGGYFFTSKGWSVSRELAKKKDLHDAIDKTIKATQEFEDSTLSFWLEKDTKVHLYHLISLHKRLILQHKQLALLSASTFPNQVLADMRRTATLDAETAIRPLAAGKAKPREILRACGKAMELPVLVKTW